MAATAREEVEVEVLSTVQAARRLGVPDWYVRKALDVDPSLGQRVGAYRVVLSTNLERIRAVGGTDRRRRKAEPATAGS